MSTDHSNPLPVESFDVSEVSSAVVPRSGDPLAILIQRRRRAWHTCGLLVLLLGMWGMWPVVGEREADGPTTASVPSGDSTAMRSAILNPEGSNSERRRFNPEAFNVALWTPPPVQDVIASAPPPLPPPLKLQLLGITRGAGSTGDSPTASALRACLYDPDTDRVLIVAQGDTLGSFTVRELTAEGVEFVDGTRVERLSLRDTASSVTVPDRLPAVGGTR